MHNSAHHDAASFWITIRVRFRRVTRTIAIVLALIVGLAVAGCGSSKNSSSSAASASSTSSPATTPTPATTSTPATSTSTSPPPTGATVSPAAYVKSACTALGSWSQGVRAAGTRLQTAARGTKSLAAGKKQYQQFVAELVTDTSKALGALKTAGAPKVSGGSQISGALVTAFTQAKTGLDQASSQAAGIPTSSPSAYQAAASGVTATIRQAISAMARVSPRRDPQLHSAALKEPACQALKTSGG
jgi:hypothetical protein